MVLRVSATNLNDGWAGTGDVTHQKIAVQRKRSASAEYCVSIKLLMLNYLIPRGCWGFLFRVVAWPELSEGLLVILSLFASELIKCVVD